MRFLGWLLAAILALPLLCAGSAQAQTDYRIRPGDVLRIEVLEDNSLNRTALVAPDGRITLPLAGAIQASGRSVEDVMAQITSKIAGNFAATPNVYVGLEKLAERQASTGGSGVAAAAGLTVFVIGEAAKPGKVGVKPGSTLLQVFSEMGGFSKFAAKKRIQLRRMDKRTGVEAIYKIDYDAIEKGLSTSGNLKVVEGDVILVPQRSLFE
jgi:polysaccharide biosynthesis/export protein